MDNDRIDLHTLFLLTLILLICCSVSFVCGLASVR